LKATFSVSKLLSKVRAMSTYSARQWENVETLVNDLLRYRWKTEWVEVERARLGDLTLPELIKEAISGNTFRAFRVYKGRRPSKVFRGWVYQTLSDGAFKALLRVRSQKAYDRWLFDFARDLRRHWARQMGCPMPYACALKLVNIVMKHLVFYQEMCLTLALRMISFLHVPLDHYSLVAVRRCVREFPEQQVVERIPAHATMCFVDSPEKYDALQIVMRRIAKKAGVPPIVIDVLAWNEQHQK
jgi:hypothetical protein